MKKVQIEACCDILDSKRVPITAADRQAGPYPYYGANGIQDYVSDYIFDDELVLLAEDGGNFGSTTKPIAYRVSGKCWVNNHAHVLKPKAGMDVDYLCYALMFYHVDGMVNGATRKKLTQSALRQMKIPLVPLEEQRLIVRKIKTVVSIKNKRKEELGCFDELVKARFIEMFGDPIQNPLGWSVKRLSELSSLITNGTTPNGGIKNYTEHGIIFLRSQNVWRNKIDLSDVVCIDENLHKELSKSSVHFKDILLTKTGRINTENSSLGRAALYLGKDDSANINGHVYLIRLKQEEVVPEYVCAMLTGEAYRTYIRKVCVGGIDKRQINLNQVQEFPIIMPPIEKQRQYADCVKQIEQSKAAVQRSLEETQTLFNSLMQTYFG